MVKYITEHWDVQVNLDTWLQLKTEEAVAAESKDVLKNTVQAADLTLLQKSFGRWQHGC